MSMIQIEHLSFSYPSSFDPIEPTPQPGDYCVPRRTGSGEGGTGA